jgi:hypothetical protein
MSGFIIFEKEIPGSLNIEKQEKTGPGRDRIGLRFILDYS